jgi:hypothetical protein
MADGNQLTVGHETRMVQSGPSYDQLKEMAHYFARSGMFGVSTPEQAFSLLMIAQSEGLHPARAMQEYHVIKNRPTLKAEAMLGRFQQAGGKVKWVKHADDEVIAEFTHDASGTTEVSWNMARAKTAGVTGNDTWRKYPRQMLRARVISEGVRLSYPACIVGFYVPEEVEAFAEPARTATVHAVQPLEDFQDAEIVEAPKPLPTGSVAPLDANGMTNKEIRVSHKKLSDGIAACQTIDALRQWRAAWEDELEELPEDIRADLWAIYEHSRDAFKAVAG